MSLSDLLKEREIEKIEPDKNLVKEFVDMSKRDLVAAEDNIKIKQFSWALAISYNAMLYAGRALMSEKGYRTTSESHHLGVVKFCAELLPKESGQLVSIFNRYRIRRNDVVYGEAEQVGEEEAKTAVENAKKFLEKIKEYIR